MVFMRFLRFRVLVMAITVWAVIVAEDETTNHYQVLQEPPAEQRLGVMYLFPHANGGHPALESQQTLNHFAELGILDTMRSCNQNSTRLIHQELCKLRRDENLSTIFVPAHLMQHLAEDGCFRSSWQDRYIKHLDRSNIDWRKVDTDCNAELVKGGQAKALYGYQLPNPYGLFSLQHRDTVRICPLEVQMLRGATPWDQDRADEAFRDCEGSNCAELQAPNLALISPSLFFSTMQLRLSLRDLRQEIYRKRRASVVERLASWFDSNPHSVVGMLHSQFVSMDAWPEGIAVRKFRPTMQLEEACTALAQESKKGLKRNEL